MLKKTLLSAAAVLTFAATAQAADIIEPTAYDWTGPYIGIQGGYAWGENDVEVDVPGTAEALRSEPVVLFPEDDGSIDMDGGMGGLHLGYLWQDDSLVFGIEADGEFADIEGDTDILEFPDGPPIGELEQQIEWLASLRARLGFAMDRTLIYATGGLAVGGVEFSGDINFGPTSDSEDSTEWGWTIGGGIEQAFTDSLSARIEYRYTDLSKSDLTLSRFEFDVDNDFHAVRLGLSWHFDSM
jgi:outer membrane immunogenic protein